MSTPRRNLPLALLAPMLGVAVMAGCHEERSAQVTPAATDGTSSNDSRPVLAPQTDASGAHGSSAGTMSNAPLDDRDRGTSPVESTDHSMDSSAQQSSARTLHTDAAEGSTTPPDSVPQNAQSQTPSATSDH